MTQTLNCVGYLQVAQTLKRVGKLEGVDSIMQPIIGCSVESSSQDKTRNYGSSISSSGSSSKDKDRNGGINVAYDSSSSYSSSSKNKSSGSSPVASNSSSSSSSSSIDKDSNGSSNAASDSGTTSSSSSSSKGRDRNGSSNAAPNSGTSISGNKGRDNSGDIQARVKDSGIFSYRNKMQFTFSSLCWDPAALGAPLRMMQSDAVWPHWCKVMQSDAV